MDTANDRSAQKMHILLIYPGMIPSIRLCGYTQLEDLNSRGLVDFKAVRNIHLRQKDLRWADVVLLGRADSWYENMLVRQLHKAGKCVAYIIDDDLLNIPSYLTSFSYFNRRGIRRNIQQMLHYSDLIISPSPLLLSKYAPEGSGRKGLRIEEPAVLPVSYAPHDPTGPVRIGFAGSVDRTRDVETILKDALLRIKAEYGEKVSFCFYGAIPSFADALAADTIPYCNSYDIYRETLNNLQWDIGLAPMPETPFHACKHYNKFVEYATSGIVGIYSDTEPYVRLKDWEDAGLFCKNDTDSWYSSIKYLLENRDRLEQMRRKVCEYGHRELSIQSSSENFYRELTAAVPRKKTSDFRLYFVPLYKVAYFFARGFYFFVRGFYFLVNHRKELPAAIAAKLRSLKR